MLDLNITKVSLFNQNELCNLRKTGKHEACQETRQHLATEPLFITSRAQNKTE